jgi:hypothetical protein
LTILRAFANRFHSMKRTALLFLATSVLIPAMADIAPRPRPTEPAPAVAPVPAPEAIKQDFQSLEVGKVPDELMVVEGGFEIVAEGENKMLQIGVEPLTEGGVLIGKSLKTGGTIKAKIRASSKRRSFPRFAVGIGGTSGYRLRVVPAEKIVEFVKEDTRVAKADFAWKSDAWFWVELSVLPSADGKTWQVTGRSWEDGQARPEAATLSFTAPEAPSSGKASVWGAPFSEKPIQFDDVEVTPGK